ncbi:MAG TPA: hypothetical protein VMV10_19435 [Pirellulales bacterium]|nr:hypothetical protein [Pirellulales bacterium]
MQREGSESPNELGEAAELWPAIRERATERRAPPRLPPPRLSVKYILLWIAGAAAAMAAVRRLNPVEPGAIGLLLVSGYAAGCGAAWTGLSLWIARALRGASWPVEPGHWLLVALGTRLALELAIRLGAPQAFVAPHAVLDAATCCLFVLPLLSRSLPALWKGCFAFLCLLAAWPLAMIVLESFGIGLPEPLAVSGMWVERQQSWLVALTAGGFALADWRAWRKRTWLHWTGLGVVLWLALLAALPR